MDQSEFHYVDGFGFYADSDEEGVFLADGASGWLEGKEYASPSGSTRYDVGLKSFVEMDGVMVWVDSYSEENGNQTVVIDGTSYTWEAKNGDWLVAQEIITTVSGVGFELGAQIEQYNSEWNGVLTIDPETYQITSKVDEGAPIEGMVYNPETGKINMTFYSDGLGRDFTEIIDADLITFRFADGVARSVKTINYAFTLGADGQIERMNVVDKEGETSVPFHTMAEVKQMIIEDHSKAKGANEETVDNLDKLVEIFMIRGTGGFLYYQIDDLYIKSCLGLGEVIKFTYLMNKHKNMMFLILHCMV